MSKARDLADFQGSASALTTGTLPVDRVPYVGRRNLIINGAMQVAQRGTSFTGVTSTGYQLDRFRWSMSNLGTWTVTQDTDSPDGFAKSLKVECTTADTPASTDTLFLYHALEGQDLQQLGFGTSNASDITLSFWVKSSKTGNAQVNIRNVGSAKHIGSSYTISAANTWEHKVVTFSGDTVSSLTESSSKAMQLEWWLDGGSSYTSGAVPTSWEAVSNADLCASNFALANSTGNTWQITGVQLELGSVATPFEHRSYGEELALCQRYFQAYDQPPLRGVSQVSDQIYRMGMVIPQMRTSPSASLTDYLNWYDSSGTGSCTIKVNYSTKYLCELDFNITSGSTAGGRPICIYQTGATGHFLYLDAEL